VLAQSIYREGSKLVAAGHNPMELKRGIDAAVSAVIESLKSSRPRPRARKTSRRFGTISANGDTEIGEMIRRGDEEGRQGRRDHGRVRPRR